MQEQMVGGSAPAQILFYSLVLGVITGVAWLFHFFLRKFSKRLAQKTKTHLDDTIVSATDKPVMAVIILAGVYLALISLPLEPTVRQYAGQGIGILLSLLSIYTVVALLNVMIKWYVREVLGTRKEVGFAGRLLGGFRAGVFLAAILLAILATLRILGIGAAPIAEWLSEHGWRIAFIAVLSVAAVIAAVEFVPRLVVRTLAPQTEETEEDCKKRGDTLSRVMVSTIQVVVIVMAAFMVLSELQINIVPILTGVGVAGIAIGFGAQSLVKDIVNGLFIVFENQYRVGDVVRVADVAGLVEDVNLRRTVLRDLDGIVHVIPNGEVRIASNFTKEWSRVNMNISVAYGEDLDRVISVINRVGKELAEDAEWAPSFITPPQVLGVDNFGDSGIEVKILGETKPIRQWDIMRQLRLRLKKAFDKEGIEIPWPHTKVYFGNLPPDSLTYGKAGTGTTRRAE